MYDENTIERSRADFVSKVMAHMGVGLLITFVTAYLVYSSELLQALVLNLPMMIILFISELVIVSVLSRRVDRMTVSQAKAGFMFYAVINGLTLSTIFIVYQISTIYYTFLISSIVFLAAGFIGMSVKKDLSAFGQFLYMLLIGLIVVSIAAMFFSLPSIDLAITAVGIFVFSGLTAYDMQKIKQIHYSAYSMDGEAVGKYAVLGALTLYLDFINLFLYILRLFGRRR